MPKFILDELIGQVRIDALLPILLLFRVSVFILEGFVDVLQAHMEIVSMKSVQHCSKILGQKVMEMDYRTWRMQKFLISITKSAF